MKFRTTNGTFHGPNGSTRSRWLNDAEQIDVRRDAGDAIASVDKAIHKTLHTFGRRLLTRDDHDDAGQDIRTRLYTHALPLYDAWRQPRVKLTTFLIRCICFHASEIMRHHRRQVRPGPITDVLNDSMTAPDRTRDRLIERLAASLLADPERLGRHAHAILSNARDITNIQAAARLGIATQTFTIARVDARKKAVAILDTEAA